MTLKNNTQIYAPIIVNAAGPYSSRINDMAFRESNQYKNDSNIFCRVMRQEVAYAMSPTGTDTSTKGWMIPDFDNGTYMRSDSFGQKILIGTIEPECDTLNWIDSNNPDDIDYSLSEESTTLLYRAALRFPTLPLQQNKNSMGIVSSYDVTQDWTPVYDKSNIPGYYLAYGTSGNQFKNAGIIGKIMAEIINKCSFQNADHDRESLRLDLEYTFRDDVTDESLNQIDLGRFSRLREVSSENNNVFG